MSVIVAVLLAAACAQQPERGAMLDASKPPASPWELPTSTMS
jgi:hypothetical protein